LSSERGACGTPQGDRSRAPDHGRIRPKDGSGRRAAPPSHRPPIGAVALDRLQRVGRATGRKAAAGSGAEHGDLQGRDHPRDKPAVPRRGCVGLGSTNLQHLGLLPSPPGNRVPTSARRLPNDRWPGDEHRRSPAPASHADGAGKLRATGGGPRFRITAVPSLRLVMNPAWEVEPGGKALQLAIMHHGPSAVPSPANPRSRARIATHAGGRVVGATVVQAWGRVQTGVRRVRPTRRRLRRMPRRSWSSFG